MLQNLLEIAQAGGLEVRNGRSNYCPFHGGKTSGGFAVYPDHFHCFQCGAHGSARDLYRQLFGREMEREYRRPLPSGYRLKEKAYQWYWDAWSKACDKLHFARCGAELFSDYEGMLWEFLRAEAIEQDNINYLASLDDDQIYKEYINGLGF